MATLAQPYVFLSCADIFKTDAEISRSNGSGFNKSFQVHTAGIIIIGSHILLLFHSLLLLTMMIQL